AIDGALQSDLKGASTVLELDKANGDLYPTTKENANDGKGLKSSDGTTLDYAYSSGDNSYCLTATKEGRSYYINSEERVPVQGSCPVNKKILAMAFGKSDSYEEINKIIKTNDGGFAVTGTSWQSNKGDIFIAKFSSDKKLSWYKTWGREGSDEGWAIVQTSDNGFTIAGVADDYIHDQGIELKSILIKYDINGNLMWNKTWVDSSTSTGGNIRGLIQLSDNSYILTGWTNYGNRKIINLKFDLNGNFVWNKQWSKTDYDVFSTSITKTNDGGFAITGNAQNWGVDAGALISKYNANGDLVWSKLWKVGTHYYEAGTGDGIVQTTDGSYVITGHYYFGDQGMCIFKLDINGNLIWSRGWSANPGNQAIGTAVINTNDGGYAVTGFNWGYGVDFTAFLSKYTTNGDLSWNKAWQNGNFEANGSDVIQLNNDYIIAGDAGMDYSDNYDAVLIAYSSNGLIDGCPSEYCINPATTNINLDANAIMASNGLDLITPSYTINSPTSTVAATDMKLSSIDAPEPQPPLTVIFSNQELYIAYPGENQNTCKEWTAPDGKKIKGFKPSHETETWSDYFTVYLDGVMIYNMSGNRDDIYIDTSKTPGTTLKACLSTDSSSQWGYGGQVTGVFYN
ncbi:hypothetical protein CVV43_04680, partial [Candidatus Saccharibacteria bacterium HGW-Saccharibacteria-1]